MKVPGIMKKHNTSSHSNGRTTHVATGSKKNQITPKSIVKLRYRPQESLP